MKKQKNHQGGIRLRDDAEKRLAESSDTLTEIISQTPEKLIHELQVHQIELEMMNEELRKANIASGEARDRYAELYDFAPVGYFTFTHEALISEVNLTGASMLGVERRKLINSRFRAFISSDAFDLWDSHFMEVLKHGKKQSCELAIICADKSLFYIRLDSIRIDSDYGNPLIRSAMSDITERKQTEKALQESEKRCRELFDNANIGIFQSTPYGKAIAVNPEFTRMFGYESPENLYATVKDVGAELFADPQRRAEIIRIQSENPHLNEFENLYRKKDGSTFWGHLHVRSVTDSDGNSLYLEGFIKDITERRQAEEKFRKSRQILQTVVDTNPEIVLLIDSKGVILAANQPVASRLGKTIPEIIGEKIYTLLPRDIAERRMNVVETVIRTGEKTLFEDQNGERYFLNIVVPIPDNHGQIEQIFIMAVDITGRKHIEDAVRQNGEQYRSFVETMNDGFIVVDKNMEIAYVNEKFCRMTGYEKEEIVGIRFLHYFDEDNQKIVEEQFMKSRRGETAPYQVESVRKDGSRMFINVSPKPVYDSDGVFHGSFAVITDITIRKEAETMRIMEQQAMQEQSAIIDKLNTEVEEYNHALKVLLKNSQNEQKAVEENIVSNVREMVMPFFEKLKKTHLSETQKNLLNGIDINLKHIVSPFVSRLKAELRDLTPMEIQVANLVREGKSNIEIGDILGVSEHTAMFHRRNIRKKLGLQHQSVNLRTYLLSLSTP